MLTMDELEKVLRERNLMIKKVINGEKVICPKCKKGYLKNRGKYFFYCDFEKCNIRICCDPIR